MRCGMKAQNPPDHKEIMALAPLGRTKTTIALNKLSKTLNDSLMTCLVK